MTDEEPKQPSWLDQTIKRPSAAERQKQNRRLFASLATVAIGVGVLQLAFGDVAYPRKQTCRTCNGERVPRGQCAYERSCTDRNLSIRIYWPKGRLGTGGTKDYCWVHGSHLVSIAEQTGRPTKSTFLSCRTCKGAGEVVVN